MELQKFQSELYLFSMFDETIDKKPINANLKFKIMLIGSFALQMMTKQLSMNNEQ